MFCLFDPLGFLFIRRIKRKHKNRFISISNSSSCFFFSFISFFFVSAEFTFFLIYTHGSCVCVLLCCCVVLLLMPFIFSNLDIITFAIKMNVGAVPLNSQSFQHIHFSHLIFIGRVHTTSPTITTIKTDSKK